MPSLSCLSVYCFVPASSETEKISQSQTFNVGTAGAKIFSGPASDQFGYTVQQATNQWFGDSYGVFS
ncbi:hypothetical protein ATANTOWER_031283 [Ataeniobius toweri]|uniref:Uncharacterized protein n=1 Tax=Ataeniobius toweri TaxID=208326 RepID=A0ABU7AII3_9TELE|nr:hypothetical protein [Ataeniobius toweri]